ncbi:Phosphatidylinositol 4-kinase gamma 4 [Euphorbia peplus]|nr:Phosphatidylinositol 4-kinase gamma 4 [Euphorbia peplus]
MDYSKLGRRNPEIKLHFVEMDNIKRDIPKYPLLVDSMETFSRKVREVARRSYEGMAAGNHPEPISKDQGGGGSGSYFIYDLFGECISIFKPCDEEKKKEGVEKEEEERIEIGTSFLGGIPVGGAAAREIAAYYLDHPLGDRRDSISGENIKGFGGVPPTFHVSCLDKKFNYLTTYEYKFKNYKIGSLQMFMKNKGSFTQWKNGKVASRIAKKERTHPRLSQKKVVLKIISEYEAMLKAAKKEAKKKEDEEAKKKEDEEVEKKEEKKEENENEKRAAAAKVIEDVIKKINEDYKNKIAKKKEKGIPIEEDKKDMITEEDVNPVLKGINNKVLEHDVVNLIHKDDVHKLCLLDIRLANLDRHGGNILINKTEDGNITLIPIDHGYSLPTRFDTDPRLVWLEWPQAKDSDYSKDVKDYVKSLDAHKDVAYLKKYNFTFKEKLPRTFCIATKLLQLGVEKKLSMFDIGSFMCKKKGETESEIKKIVDESERIADKHKIITTTESGSDILLGIVYYKMDLRLQPEESTSARST